MHANVSAMIHREMADGVTTLYRWLENDHEECRSRLETMGFRVENFLGTMAQKIAPASAWAYQAMWTIFHQNVLQDRFDQNVIANSALPIGQLGTKILFLHSLYNRGDEAARITKIQPDSERISAFRYSMRAIFDLAVSNLLVSLLKGPPATLPDQEHADQELSDYQIAMRMQSEFDHDLGMYDPPPSRQVSDQMEYNRVEPPTPAPASSYSSQVLTYNENGDRFLFHLGPQLASVEGSGQFSRYPLERSIFKVIEDRHHLDFEAVKAYTYPIFLFRVDKKERSGMIWFNTSELMFTFIDQVLPSLPKEISFTYDSQARNRPARVNNEKIIEFTWTNNEKLKDFVKYIVKNNTFTPPITEEDMVDFVAALG